MKTRHFAPTLERLAARTLPSTAPVAQIGHVVAITGGDHATALAFVNDAGKLEVDYGNQGIDGPLTSYTFDLRTVSAIAFVGRGDGQYFEDDTNVVRSVVLMVGNGCGANGSLEPDLFILVGSNDYADGGGGDDAVYLID